MQQNLRWHFLYRLGSNIFDRRQWRTVYELHSSIEQGVPPIPPVIPSIILVLNWKNVYELYSRIIDGTRPIYPIIPPVIPPVIPTLVPSWKFLYNTVTNIIGKSIIFPTTYWKVLYLLYSDLTDTLLFSWHDLYSIDIEVVTWHNIYDLRSNLLWSPLYSFPNRHIANIRWKRLYYIEVSIVERAPEWRYLYFIPPIIGVPVLHWAILYFFLSTKLPPPPIWKPLYRLGSDIMPLGHIHLGSVFLRSIRVPNQLGSVVPYRYINTNLSVNLGSVVTTHTDTTPIRLGRVRLNSRYLGNRPGEVYLNVPQPETITSGFDIFTSISGTLHIVDSVTDPNRKTAEIERSFALADEIAIWGYRNFSEIELTMLVSDVDNVDSIDTSVIDTKLHEVLSRLSIQPFAFYITIQPHTSTFVAILTDISINERINLILTGVHRGSYNLLVNSIEYTLSTEGLMTCVIGASTNL